MLVGTNSPRANSESIIMPVNCASRSPTGRAQKVMLPEQSPVTNNNAVRWEAPSEPNGISEWNQAKHVICCRTRLSENDFFQQQSALFTDLSSAVSNIVANSRSRTSTQGEFQAHSQSVAFRTVPAPAPRRRAQLLRGEGILTVRRQHVKQQTIISRPYKLL